MLKKIISVIAACVIAFSSVALADTNSLSKLSFNSVNDWSMTQGENSWYYQYTTDGTYTGYKDMTWATKGSNTTYHGSNNTGAFVDNFYVKVNTMHIGGGNLRPARVWVAPYPGVVRVASVGNVRKTGTHTAGEAINVNVVKTDNNKKNETVLWSSKVLQGDTIGAGNSYSFDVKVEKGDRLYFEAYASSAANGGVVWETMVDYRQAAYFAQSGKQITSASEVGSESIIDCVFYDLKNIEDDVKLYLTVYDESGRMRKMSNVTNVDIENFEDRKAEISVSMPKLSEGKSFAGWSIKLFGITNISGRYWPVEISDIISLD